MTGRIPALLLVLASAGAQTVRAAEVHGGGDLGFWYLQNDVASAPGFVLDDGYGTTLVEERYMLGTARFKLDAFDLGDGGETTYNARFDGRLLWNINEHSDTFAIPDRTRQEIEELSLEIVSVAPKTDLWLGRQTLYETGGTGVDGVRGVYHLSESLDCGAYGGLSNDPRNATGYIGPSYRGTPFSTKFQAAGAFLARRTERSKLDAAVNALLFKGRPDRLAVFAQASHQLNPVWGFSGLADVGVSGDRGLKSLQASVTARPTGRFTNTVSFYRFESLRYVESNSSAIPVPAGIDPALVGGNDVDTSSYNSGREHLQVRIFERNYLFGAFQFTRRTFDDKNQFKYTAGYRDPTLFGSTFDLRLQTDVIDNYRGFNTVFDLLLGKEFGEGKLRLEGGASFHANERDFAVEQTEKERAFRFNLFYLPNRTLSWLVNYTLHQERDFANDARRVAIHDLYLSTGFRF